VLPLFTFKSRIDLSFLGETVFTEVGEAFFVKSGDFSFGMMSPFEYSFSLLIAISEKRSVPFVLVMFCPVMS